MPEDANALEQVEAVRRAFEQEFERFARFRPNNMHVDDPALADAESMLRSLVDLRTRHTGKKSQLAGLKKMIGRVAAEDRARFAQRVQQLDVEITESIGDIEQALKEQSAVRQIERERIDVTLPGRRPRRGHLHPITILRERIEDIFVSMGYAVEAGLESETDFYNFDALNISPWHPARSAQDTFYTTDDFALR